MVRLRTPAEAEEFLAGSDTHRSGRVVILPETAAAIIQSPQDRGLPGIEVTVYYSPNDGQPVIEIDTQELTGEIRVYVNNCTVYAADPEED